MRVPSAWARRDWALAALLGMAVALTRLPFRSDLLFNWDAADFALALRHYDVTQFQPHPPGYPVYIALAWLFSLVLGDHNASLVAVSVLFSALAVAALYAVGTTIGGRRTGLIAALFLAFSVTYWTYGGLALAYVSLAFFSGLVALFSYETLLLGRDRLLPLTAVYALAGGFRAELLLFLAPLWLACLGAAARYPLPLGEGEGEVSRATSAARRWRSSLMAIALAAAIVLAWALPMMLLSGGPVAYFSLLFNYSDQDVIRRYSVPARGVEGLWVNLRDTASYVFYAMYAIAPLFVAAVVAWVRAAARGWGGASKPGTRNSELALMGWAGLWVGPMLLFYNLIHVGDPGYVFSFYPALLLFTASWLARLSRTAPSGGASVGTGADTQVRPYRGRPIPLIPFRGWEGEGPGARASRPPVPNPLSPPEGGVRVRARGAGSRSLLVVAAVGLALATNTAIFHFHQRPLTAWGVRAADAALAARLAYVQEHYAPGEAVLLASDSVRHLRYYLPDYREHWVDRLSPFQRRASLGEGVRAIVLFDPDLLALAPQAEVVDLGPARLGVVQAPAGSREVAYGREGIGVE